MLFFGKKRLSNVDLCRFFRIVQRYNRAGVTLLDAVDSFVENADEGMLKNVTLSILRDMRNGINFSDSLRKHDEFPAFIVEIVQVGEDTGQVSKVLDEIVFYLEQEIDVQREVSQALWTPKAFIVGMMGAFSLALFLVIPKMGELLEEAHIELPAITQFVIDVGNFAQSFWWAFVLAGFGIKSVHSWFKAKYPEKEALLQLRIPFFKEIYYAQLQYRFAKIFGLCTNAGIRVNRSLQYTALASDNLAMKLMLLRAIKDMEKSGAQAWDALKKADTYGILNKDFFIMIRVGSETGQMGNILLAEAENYQKDMLAASKLIGDKVGITVTIPGYLGLIFLFAAIEYPVITMMQNMNMGGGGM